jgi:two-component system phosphate regulon sensor histidine kinase PhoR
MTSGMPTTPVDIAGPRAWRVFAVLFVTTALALAAWPLIAGQAGRPTAELYERLELLAGVLAGVAAFALFGRYAVTSTRLALVAGCALLMAGAADLFRTLVALDTAPYDELSPLVYGLFFALALALERDRPHGVRPALEIAIGGPAAGVLGLVLVFSGTAIARLPAGSGQAIHFVTVALIAVLTVVYGERYRRRPTLLGLGLLLSLWLMLLSQLYQSASLVTNSWPYVGGEAAEVLAYAIVLGTMLYESPQLIQAHSANTQELVSLQQASHELFVGTQQAYFDIKRLHELGQLLAQTFDLAVLLRTVVDHTQGVIEAPACFVLLTDPLAAGDPLRLAHVAGPEPYVSRLRARQPYPSMSELALPATVFRSGRALVVSDAARGPAAQRDLIECFGLHSGVLVPMAWRGQSLGVLVFADERAPRDFTPSQIETAQGLAAQVAVAVQNARLYTSVLGERQTLKAVLDSGADVVLVTDEQGALLMFNPAATEALGVTSADVGRPLVYVVPSLPAQVLGAFTEAVTRAEMWEHPLADRRTLLARLSPVSGLGAVIVMHDITHLKEFDRLRSELFAAVVHDLKNPLNLTLGSLELLLEDFSPLSGDHALLADSARRGLVRMQALISDLLDLEKIRAGVGSERRSCAIDELLREVLHDLSSWTQDKGVVLHSEVAPGLPAVPGDPRQLARVFHNLIGNAVKYTPAGGTVNVRAQVEHDRMMISVRDTGVGIAPGDLPYVFDRFYRATNTIADGTGLGLTIVKTIIEQHGGRVWVDSEIGRGSVFHVSLPVEREPLAA